MYRKLERDGKRKKIERACVKELGEGKNISRVKKERSLHFTA